MTISNVTSNSSDDVSRKTPAAGAPVSEPNIDEQLAARGWEIEWGDVDWSLDLIYRGVSEAELPAFLDFQMPGRKMHGEAQEYGSARNMKLLRIVERCRRIVAVLAAVDLSSDVAWEHTEIGIHDLLRDVDEGLRILEKRV